MKSALLGASLVLLVGVVWMGLHSGDVGPPEPTSSAIAADFTGAVAAPALEPARASSAPPLRRQPMSATSGALDGESAGATIRGRIGPHRLLRHFRRPGNEGDRPVVHVVREQHGELEVFPRRAVLRRDGTFELSDVPPGTWDVRLTYWIPSVSYVTEAVIVESSVKLETGETRDLNARLDHLVPGTLSGSVLLDGWLLDRGSVILVSRSSADDGRFVRKLDLSAGGAFSCQVLAGTYGVEMLEKRGKRNLVTVTSTNTTTVTAGGRVHGVFHLRAGSEPPRQAPR